MKVLIATAFLAQIVAAAVDVHTIPRHSTANVVSKSYIVQLKKGLHTKRGFPSPHAELYHDLKARSVTWESTKEYSDELFTGAAIKLGSQSDLVKLARAASVEAIYPNYLHRLPEHSSPVVITPDDVSYNGADSLSTHKMTGVDELHAKGIFGEGVTVGIIDTGIDYTHPALGGKFGPGNKVAGGYDFVGDAYTGTNVPQPDNDPLDQCEGHGTHVAGIIGANPDNSFNISGVAYEATINAYRVFGCTGFVADDVLIEALERAYKDGNDIINLSLGGPEGWTAGVTSVVASRIAAAGRIVTISAGNDGEYGSWYTSGPATGLDVIAVGSVDNTIVNVQNLTVSTGRTFPYGSLLPLDIPDDLPIYATSSNTSVADDACDPFPSSTPNLSNHLVIIRRGTCFIEEKLKNAAASGARYFLVYDNVEEPLISATWANYTAALISQRDGVYLVEEAIPKKATIKFGNRPFALASSTGGLVSYFSTYGPTNDMYFKPAISAPGGDILSTYPLTMGEYAVLSGTSMSAPFVAGSAALLLQVRGRSAEVAKFARSIFENTAKPISNSRAEGSVYETAAHQGAGLVQVHKAAYGAGSIFPAELLLNDTANFRGQHSINITNWGTEAVTYSLRHVPAGTAPTIKGIENLPGPVELLSPMKSGSNVASVTITPSNVVVAPGSSAMVAVSFIAPTGLDPTAFPVYSGFIQANGSDGSLIHSTYLGVAASLKDMKVIDDTDSYFDVKLPLIRDKDGNPINSTTTYSMQGNDTPEAVYRLVAGSPLVRIDLVDYKADLTANQPRSVQVMETRKLNPPRDTEPDIHTPRRNASNRLSSRGALPRGPITSTFAHIQTLGTLYQEDFVPRNSAATTAEDNGYTEFVVDSFLNGTAIPDGRYRILFRAARIASDTAQEEVWTSLEIVIKRA
ncbi:hypothetical protein FRC12_018728 [Ceratobasidium sp. 428]|nr:hypothetical protein FRC09_004103 [Ceratobasidium sp. 395]KAG8784415.1 hypothetical protein FRC12_018728 [Ceratobasidium sp. 428]